jgi:hypothetical protein
LRVWGFIPDTDGARVEIALNAGADKAGPDENGQWEPLPARCADVFVDKITADLPEDGGTDRATVVIHVPDTALLAESDTPGAYIDTGDTGVPIANDTARRLACDSLRQFIIEDARGVPIRLGRRTRTVPNHLFRLLKQRDRHCRAPGCSRTRGLHAHHRVHWRDGGETDLDNLILVCSRHHRLLHEHHWQICGHLSQPETIEIRRPDGRVITPYRPPPLDPAVRERFLVTVS